MQRLFGCSCVGIAFVLFAAACGRPNLGKFNSPDQKQISSNVVLHRTSGSTVTLTDAEGVGLVYGNIKRIGYERGGKRYFFVVFEPFSNNSGGERTPSQEVAKIDLSTGQVTPTADVDGSIAKSLDSINSFF